MCGARWPATLSTGAHRCARCAHEVAAALVSSQREQRKASMAAAAAARTEPGARPAVQTAIRSKKVRITLDLTPELYRELTRWAESAAITLDVPRVSLADAVRAMIR